MIEAMTQGKTCTKCGEWKPFEGFHKNKASKDGFLVRCKECTKQYYQENKERIKQYRQENRESILEQHRRYNLENKERNRQYRQENKERLNEKKKNYYRENESFREYKRKYRQENKEHYKEIFKRYFQTEKGKEIRYKAKLKRRSYKHYVSFKPHERKQILDRDKWQCQSCGIKVHDRRTGDWNTPDKAHIDHVIPISKGGNSEPSNLQTLCRTCNLSKNDKVELQLELF
jgi:5-methylcytosine-specific restriction endonuclease McrA